LKTRTNVWLCGPLRAVVATLAQTRLAA